MVSKIDGSYIDIPVDNITEGMKINNIKYLSNNLLRITISKPAPKGTSLEICSTDGLFCKEIGFERGENEINITIPEIISGTILLVLKNNQNVINHQKYKLK